MKLPSKEWLIAQIKKNFWKRVSWLSFISIVALLGDEYIKEGYFFDINDIPVLGTHENLIIISLLVALVATILRRWVKE